MALVLFWKRRKAKKSKPSATSTTGHFENPTYATSENPPEIKENFYSSCQFDNPAYAASEEPPEITENVYSTCLGFDNPALAATEEPPEIQEDEYASLDDDQIYENVVMRPVIAK